MSRGVLVLIVALVLIFHLVGAEAATTQPILPGSLAKLDIKDAEIERTRGVPRGTFTIAQHFALELGRAEAEALAALLVEERRAAAGGWWGVCGLLPRGGADRGRVGGLGRLEVSGGGEPQEGGDG